jgi:hypothetical protein
VNTWLDSVNGPSAAELLPCKPALPNAVLPIAVTRRRWFKTAGLGMAAWTLPALALDAPQGPVVLTVSGKVRKPNGGTAAHFDLTMLAAMAQQTINTRTPWYSQPRRFTGPLLRDVLRAAGASGNTLRLIALNDYRVDMPFDDTQRYDVLLARLLDDQPMTVRDKGPLFVIYPFDSRPELRSAVYYSRSAWQLRTIEVA